MPVGNGTAVYAKKDFGRLSVRNVVSYYVNRFPLRIKGADYKSYAIPEVLYSSLIWCLRENKEKILSKTEQ